MLLEEEYKLKYILGNDNPKNIECPDRFKQLTLHQALTNTQETPLNYGEPLIDNYAEMTKEKHEEDAKITRNNKILEMVETLW